MQRNRVVRKFLGRPSTTPNDPIDPPSTDYPLQLRPATPQSSIYEAGSPLTCLDRSPDGQRAIIAGPNVLSILKVEGSTITQDFDLRGAITSSISSEPTSATAEQFNIGAIQWAHERLRDNVLTASGNGRITLYDLNRGGYEVARINDHNRQVHKIRLNPHRSSWLLSASHDGTIKMFDLRHPSKSSPQIGLWAKGTFKGNADAVRDVAWSPSDGYDFACSTDAGVIMYWDFRQPKAPVLNLRAHSKPCFSIAWHSDGQHLISGGMDQMCKVWNLSKSAQKNQAPQHVFHTPAPISCINWKPALQSSTSRKHRSAQVSISYDGTGSSRNSAVHIWDLARPSLPYKTLDNWESSPTGSLWSSRDLLWCVDGDGRFTQTDAAFVPKLLDSRSLSSFSFSSRGDTLMFLEKRTTNSRTGRSKHSQDGQSAIHAEASLPIYSTSKSDSEDDAVAEFLGTQTPRHHQRRQSDRTSQQISTVHPNSTGVTEKKSLSLTESIDITGLFVPKQVMAFGSAPGGTSKALYQYYSNCYLSGLEKYHQTAVEPIPVRLAKVMEDYARCAAEVGHYRLAQTWRILSLTMNKLLLKRADYHRQQRLSSMEKPQAVLLARQQKDAGPLSERGFETPKAHLFTNGKNTPARSSRSHTPHDSPSHHPVKSVIFEERESTSNVTTPLARPRPDTAAHHTRDAMQTSLTIDDDPLDLSHSTIPATPIPVPGSNNGSKPARPSEEGYDFYDTEFMAAAVPYQPPQKKAPLRFDSVPQRMQPVRHDSSESFQMFSTSSDSHGKYMSSSESDGRSSFQQNGNGTLRGRAADWESSFGSTAGGSSDGTRQTDSFDSSNMTSSSGMQDGMMNRSSGLPILRIQEASEPLHNSYPPGALSTAQQTDTNPSTPGLPQDLDIISSDYDPWPNDPQFIVQPLNPSTLVQQTVEYEASKGALHASILILLLRSYLSEDSIDQYQASAILRTYHQRLTSFQLFLEATSLRKLCVPDYPILYGSSQQNVTVGFFCTDCSKPLENDPTIPDSQWQCPRCQQHIDGCAVCKNQYLLDDIDYPEEDVGTFRNSLWWYCNGCGHGGHVTCMQAWHASLTPLDSSTAGDKYSDGCCPIIGCLHPCLPGEWRDECESSKFSHNTKALEAQVRENSARNSISRGSGRGIVAGVRKDVKEVNQSKAVEGVRLALNIAQLNSAAGTSGGGGGSVVRRKSVKMVAPGEEVQGGSRFNR